jgi:hypothetical protein
MSGFANLGNKLDLTAFQASSEPQRVLTAEDEVLADKIAERRGIPGDEVGRVQLSRGSTVQDRMFVQGPLTTLNRFRRFCNEKGVPLHKGLEILLDGSRG